MMQLNRGVRGLSNLRTAVAVLLALGLATVVPTTSAHGQDGSAPAETAARSFAEAFFVSRSMDPGGEASIEWLGSIIIWLLLGLSAASIGLIGHVAFTNQRKSIIPAGVVEEVRRMLRAGQYREAMDLTAEEESYFSQIVHAALRDASGGYSAIIRGLEQTADELTTVRLRRIEYLNVLGQVSPMIGLFGTVYGMILAFQAIVVAGGSADPVLLAGGISTALTTTFWGLVVAIPALAGYAIVRNRIDAFTQEATLEAEQMLSQFRPKAKSSKSPSGAEGRAD